MTSDKSNFELPIRFSIKPSKWVIAVIYVAHFGALVCTSLSNIPVIPMQMVCLVILSSLVYGHVRHIYRLKRVPEEFLLNDMDEWYIGEVGRDMKPAVLLPGSFVHTHLIVLMFKQENCKRRVIFTSDNLPRKIFRRLSVRLRFTLSGAQS